MEQIRVLIDKLKAANVAYYQENREIISNYEYDKLYDTLVGLEEETGIVYSDSPTQAVTFWIHFQKSSIRRKCYLWIKQRALMT